MHRLCIVGLGAAGLGAALALAHAAGEGFAVPGRDYELIILEAGTQAGRKLLLAGGGRCNLTHTGEVRDFTRHYFEGGRFLFPALHTLSPDSLIYQMERAGVPMKVETGRYFPKSERATDVLEGFLMLCEPILRGNLRLGTKVVGIHPSWTVDLTGGEQLEVNQLLLAGGGLSVPQTGSDGHLHKQLAMLGIDVTETVPGLVGLTCKHGLHELSGLSFETEFTLKPMNRRHQVEAKAYKRTGTILITEDGFSGPELLNLSRTLNGDRGTLTFQFPGLDEEALRNSPRNLSLRRILKESTSIPDRLWRKLLEQVRADHLRSPFDPAELRRKIQDIKGLVYKVQPESLMKARVTRGGVALSEVNPSSMEVKNYPGLYIAGELLDIDGESGGYNLQAAISTGYLAAQSMIAAIL